MEIRVSGRNKERREMVEAAAEFYRNVLRLSKSKYSVQIDLVPGFLKTSGMRGATIDLGEKFLSIAVDSRLSVEETLSTLAHEMVHAKQYALGQLRHGEDGTSYWLGKPTVAEHYYDAPWEIEAFSRERVLANKIGKIISVAE